ncbi:uncharacterized protein H6S33_010791 [Morchella sextelata]|uniref:uncharacterized protein n=1 Tax=Morchella sextelata TaxID=1174677 RepID=UPI001D0370A7|nr:uncharacterized protein H6S33_010791 [Morchella sextelata]KAH0611526.1 hypothetical protein H6S33_010791 [Morchella sextelata]
METEESPQHQGIRGARGLIRIWDRSLEALFVGNNSGSGERGVGELGNRGIGESGNRISRKANRRSTIQEMTTEISTRIPQYYPLTL